MECSQCKNSENKEERNILCHKWFQIFSKNDFCKHFTEIEKNNNGSGTEKKIMIQELKKKNVEQLKLF